MRILVYEWVSGGGYLGRAEPPPASLDAEGRAMLEAVAADFAALPDTQVATILTEGAERRSRFAARIHHAANSAERDRQFIELAGSADATIVIAPEFDGVLLSLAQSVIDAGGRLLSPGPQFVQIASDKQETAERLHLAGVRVPRGGVIMPGEACPAGIEYPAVLKPIHGTGSLGVQLVDHRRIVPRDAGAYRLEKYIPGTPASVAVVCGNSEVVSLEPCLQRLKSDFTYTGGSLPLNAGLRERAQKLAVSAIEALPSTTGYVGVDLVMGQASDGSEDVVIEINPRYTTSYVGLRAATSRNLAEFCLAMSNGDSSMPPAFHSPVQWDSYGQVRKANRRDKRCAGSE